MSKIERIAEGRQRYIVKLLCRRARAYRKQRIEHLSLETVL